MLGVGPSRAAVPQAQCYRTSSAHSIANCGTFEPPWKRRKTCRTTVRRSLLRRRRRGRLTQLVRRRPHIVAAVNDQPVRRRPSCLCRPSYGARPTSVCIYNNNNNCYYYDYNYNYYYYYSHCYTITTRPTSILRWNVDSVMRQRRPGRQGERVSTASRLRKQTETRRTQVATTSRRPRLSRRQRRRRLTTTQTPGMDATRLID